MNNKEKVFYSKDDFIHIHEQNFRLISKKSNVCLTTIETTTHRTTKKNKLISEIMFYGQSYNQDDYYMKSFFKKKLEYSHS